MSPVRIVVCGYTSVDTRFVTEALPRPGETAILSGEVVPAPRWGGCAPNVALWLERLGVHTALVAWLGDDEEGRTYRSVLADAGVDVSAVETGTAASPRAWLVHDASGEAVCLFHPSASGSQRADAAAAFGGEAEWLAVTVGPDTLTRALLDLFAATPVAWNVKADYRAFPPDLVARLAGAALVALNRSEARFVGDALGLGRAVEPHDLLERGASVVALTHGREGAVISWAGGEIEVAQEAVPVADATGAGDAFFAGLLAALADGASPDEAGRRGLDTASHQLQGAEAS
jgi:sugar/nucleoside kinase (ribokinase family)